MSLRDYSGVPDHLVPQWILRSRLARRADQLKMCTCGLHFSARVEVLTHCAATGHLPLREETR